MLPPVVAGKPESINLPSTAVNACTLQANGGDLINGASTFVIPNALNEVQLIGNASGSWGIVNVTYPPAQSFAAHNFVTGSTAGKLSAAQPACGDLTGAAAHCGTSASELSSGVIPSAQLPNPLPAANIPNPSSSTLGGVNSIASQAHKFVNSIGTNGLPTSGQPDISDLTGLPVSVPNGGTGQSAAGAAAANAIGAAALGANSDITSMTGLTTPLSVSQGGRQCGAPTIFASLPASPTSGETCFVTDPSGCTCQIGVAVVNGGGASCKVCAVTYNGSATCGNGSQNCWLPGGNAALPANGAQVPINQLPTQTGAYSAANQRFTLLGAPTTAADALSEGAAIGSVSASTVKGTVVTASTRFQTASANPSTNGLVNDINAHQILGARNAGNTADINAFATDNGDHVVVGGVNSTGIILNNTSTVNQGAMASGAFVDVPTANAMWLGSTENCTQTWHDWVVAANNAQLLFACPLDGKIHHLYYRFYQPSNGSTFSYNFAPTTNISTPLGGPLPVPCTVNGCFDDYDVIFDGVFGTIRIQYDGTFNLLNTTPASSCPAGQTCYYVSSSVGNDSNTSTQAKSPSTPWASISKVMTILSTLNPGDQVLFKGGDTWTASANNTAFNLGDIAAHTVNGSASKPIVIGTYGVGQAIIDSNNVNNYCFDAVNPGFTVQYLTLSNFECKHSKLQGVTFQHFSASFNSNPMPGIVVQNFYIHNSGPGCATTNTGCFGSALTYNNQLDFESTGLGSEDGVQFINNVVKWSGGWNCVQAHYDRGSVLIQGNTVGPGCNHGFIDVKGLGDSTHQAKILNNVVDGGQSGSLVGAANTPAFYTENIANATSNILWQGNVAFDTNIAIQICPGGTLGGSTSGATYQLYNNTFYATGSNNASAYTACFFSSSTCNGANAGTFSGNSLDFRNNICDGKASSNGTTFSIATGTYTVACTEDYNDIGGAQGNAGYLNCANNASLSAHDFGATNPSYVSAATGNFTLNANSPVDCPTGGTANGPCAGLTGLTINNSDMGAF